MSKFKKVIIANVHSNAKNNSFTWDCIKLMQVEHQDLIALLEAEPYTGTVISLDNNKQQIITDDNLIMQQDDVALNNKLFECQSPVRSLAAAIRNSMRYYGITNNAQELTDHLQKSFIEAQQQKQEDSTVVENDFYSLFDILKENSVMRAHDNFMHEQVIKFPSSCVVVVGALHAFSWIMNGSVVSNETQEFMVVFPFDEDILRSILQDMSIINNANLNYDDVTIKNLLQQIQSIPGVKCVSPDDKNLNMAKLLSFDDLEWYNNQQIDQMLLAVPQTSSLKIVSTDVYNTTSQIDNQIPSYDLVYQQQSGHNYNVNNVSLYGNVHPNSGCHYYIDC